MKMILRRLYGLRAVALAFLAMLALPQTARAAGSETYVFEGFHFETLDIRYTTTNQRQGKAAVSSELVIMNWEPAMLGGLF